MTSPPRTLRSVDESRVEIETVIAALSTQYLVVTGPRQVVRRTRLDTFDRRLRAAGLALEQQTGSSWARLVLETSDGGSPTSAPAQGLRWPALVDVLPPGAIREVVEPLAGIRALIVVSDEKRRSLLLELNNEDTKTVARVEFDEPASATAGPAQLTVRTLRGYEEHGRRAVRVLVGMGLRIVEPGEDWEPTAVSATATIDREAPASLLLASALGGFLTTMREVLPGLLGDVDTEFLHDFRVAVRRTRATLKLGRPALPEVMRSRWEPAFNWVGDITSPVRDLDVYELGLPTMKSWLMAADPADLDPFSAHLRSRRLAERRLLERSLKSARFRGLVADWDEELSRLASTPDRPDPDVVSAGRLADRSISRVYRRVTRLGSAISDDSPAEELHKLRKRGKELRYALEVFAPVIAKDPRKRAVADLKALQNVLGRFQDSEVQRQALRGFAEEMMAEGTPAETVLAMGELIGHLDADQDRARREFDAAFVRFTRPSSQRLMRQLGGTL